VQRTVLSAGLRKLLHLVEMEPELLVELPVDRSPPEKRTKRHEDATMQAWGHHDQTVSRSAVTAADRRRHCVASRANWSRPARVRE
jgi:hypothetical protein